MNLLFEVLHAGEVTGPLCAAVRIVAMVTFGGLMIGLGVPWRYRISGALLLGWAAGSDGRSITSGLPAVLASELVFGSAIGVAAGAVLLSLKLAGELLDDRLRLTDATGQGLDGSAEPAGPCVRLLSGLAILLVLFGGSGNAMPVLEGIFASFRGVPVGSAIVVWDSWRGVAQALGASAEIALRTALPVLGALTIIDWCQVLAARAAPTAPSALAATTVKPLLGLAVLVATFGGVCDSAINTLHVALGGDWAG